MANTRTTRIKNMTAGEVADETREWLRVTSDADVLQAVVAWKKYDADNAAWLAENQDTEPPEFAAVVDEENISVQEKIFVEVRFFEEDTVTGELFKINAAWCQVNTTNTPDLSAFFAGDLLKIFNARRTKLGRDPVA